VDKFERRISHDKERDEHSKVVTPAEWVAARKELLRKERSSPAARSIEQGTPRTALGEVEKKYVFDGPGGKESLGDLFGGKSQLIIYHFMFGRSGRRLPELLVQYGSY